jgi:hypothetical protein
MPRNSGKEWNLKTFMQAFMYQSIPSVTIPPGELAISGK